MKNLYQMITIHVACAIIKNNHSILIAQRSENMPHAGLWEFPGGKIEANEIPSDALIREITEELDCQITILTVLPEFEHQYDDKIVVLHPFICNTIKGQPIPQEHQKIEWVSINDLHLHDWLEADIPIVEFLQKNK